MVVCSHLRQTLTSVRVSESLCQLVLDSDPGFARMRFYLPTRLVLMCEKLSQVIVSQLRRSIFLASLLSGHSASDGAVAALRLSLVMEEDCLCRRLGRSLVLSMLSMPRLFRYLMIHLVS